jgi:hypothetical protein
MSETTSRPLYDVTRNEAFDSLKNGDPAAAIDIASRLTKPGERVCLVADVAYASGSQELMRQAARSMSPEHYRGMGSVRGRLFMLSYLSGDPAKANEVSRLQLAGMLTPSCIGILKMLSVNEERERDVYEGLVADVEAQVLRRDNVLIPALRLVHASRVLAFARVDAGNEASRWDVSLTDNCDRFWGKYQNILVRNIQGSLWAYTKNPNEPLPRMLPYQIVSMAEVLHRAQALPQKLRREVARALGRHTKVLTPVWKAKYAEWAPFSTIVRESLEP